MQSAILKSLSDVTNIPMTTVNDILLYRPTRVKEWFML